MAFDSPLNGYKKLLVGHQSEKTGISTKRISLKALTSSANSHIPISSAFETAWPKLKRATTAVLQSKPVEFTLEELYRNVEDICAQRMLLDLYSTLKVLLKDYVAELLPVFLKYPFAMQLGSVANSWEVYCKKMLLIRNIFLFMDRQLLISNSQYVQIWDLALNLFREEVISHDKVEGRILRQLFDEIRKERSGEAVNRNLLRSIIRMFVDLKLYQSTFLPEFIRQSQQFYAQESSSFLRLMSVPDYLVHVDKRIKEEEDRLVSYLEPNSTRKLLLSTLVSELLTRTLDYLLENGLVGSLKAKETKQLGLFYSLLSKVPNGVDKLRTHFRQYVIQLGRDLVENPTQDPEKDRNMIQNLISCRDYLSELIAVCFANDANFTRVLQEAYEEFINQRPNKPAEFLAKYLDAHLRSGNKAQTDEELDKLMDKAMMLFRYIDGKDIFEAFYTKELAKRLLLNKSASVDAEKSMLSKLKQECGPNYTRKMETMFQDIELSRQLSKNFRASYCLDHSIELYVNVISPSSWPAYPQTKANYPPEMMALRDEFTRFYLSHHQGRKLLYEPSLGTCVVKAEFPLTPHLRKELQVSEFQALVLLQFNGDPNESVSYATIAEATGIEETELKRTLLSLAAGKGQRNLDVANDHTFKFNAEFQHRLTRIKFNQIQLRETKQEQEATEERVFADRVAHVDCCIVRIMKTRKTIDHNSLLSEVYKQLQFPLKASDVKKRIENLIERDYMKRDTTSAATYHYVS
ncbi:cullin family protein [Opisthorchis viverrini]|uniref:Cullin family protein n=1 Tax=Opisthorchis viverrini TaxID=6198 RepID=A0A1S8WWB9_OPIVI|nr:cullin family protein [Opisthorchis viverrini]